MTEFTPYTALLGGALLGLSAIVLFIFNARVAGCSGIINQVASYKFNANYLESALFLIGMVTAPIALMATEFRLPESYDQSWTLMLVGAFIVGLGTNIGNGCTSGHGICGVGRLSRRSIAATITFMTTAVLTVYLLKFI